MLTKRVIPTLLLHNNGLVKTTRFKDPRYVGDPINAIRIFNDKEVDELIVLDISATREGREPDYDTLEQLAGECFMPLAYGGGVSNLEQAKRIFACGVEKVCIQSAALDNVGLVYDLANTFGSQSIVVSVDIKRNWLGKPFLFRSRDREIVTGNWVDHLREMAKAGAGEILLNAVDKDGTLSGPDLSLISQGSQAVDVPVVAIGGISSLDDVKEAVCAGASAVAAGAFFVFHGPHKAILITYPKYSDLVRLFEELDG